MSSPLEIESLAPRLISMTISDYSRKEPHQVETMKRAAYRYSERRQLRSLILQGAAAAATDDESKRSSRNEQLRHLQDWIDRYQANLDVLGIDPSVDIREAVLFTWAAKVGLGALEAKGIAPPSKENWADRSAGFGRSLNLPFRLTWLSVASA